MKKLMILGGSRYAVPVIEAAHKLGLYVITCDYLPDNIAHKYSDEYCDVSIIDKEKTLEAAKKLHIDGIVSFACDPGVTTAAYRIVLMLIIIAHHYVINSGIMDGGSMSILWTQKVELLDGNDLVTKINCISNKMVMNSL